MNTTVRRPPGSCAALSAKPARGPVALNRSPRSTTERTPAAIPSRRGSAPGPRLRRGLRSVFTKRRSLLRHSIGEPHGRRHSLKIFPAGNNLALLELLNERRMGADSFSIFFCVFPEIARSRRALRFSRSIPWPPAEKKAEFSRPLPWLVPKMRSDASRSGTRPGSSTPAGSAPERNSRWASSKAMSAAFSSPATRSGLAPWAAA